MNCFGYQFGLAEMQGLTLQNASVFCCPRCHAAFQNLLVAVCWEMGQGESQVCRAEELIEQSRDFDPRIMARVSFLAVLREVKRI